MKYIAYRRRPWKYELVEDYEIYVGMDEVAQTRFLELKGCVLKIRAGYAWDGPSGPTMDTKTFMRGSLVHDALYQLIREGYLSLSERLHSDDLLYHICRQDGMNWVRAQTAYRAVRMFGWMAVKPRKADVIVYAPKKPVKIPNMPDLALNWMKPRGEASRGDSVA